jgi:hypothetical protein
VATALESGWGKAGVGVFRQKSYPLSPQKRSKENTETLSLLKTGNKVVEVG